MKSEIEEQISVYLTGDILRRTGSGRFWDNLCEIRVTLGKPVLAELAGELTVLGEGTPFGALTADRACVEKIVNAVTNGSMYSVNESIKNGFVTVKGGHRIGFCGRAVTDREGVRHIKEISSACIRICREIRGSAAALTGELFTRGRVSNILIASPPGCGKTTVLRDICRILGNGGCGRPPSKVGIADERGEIAASYAGVCQNDVGMASFVCDGYDKAQAMRMMLRSMCPDVLVTDEIGGTDDFEAIGAAVKSGVAVIATAHADSFEDLCSKYKKSLLKTYFDKIVILKGKGKIDKIYRRSENDF